MSSTIGEPFRLFLSSTLSQRVSTSKHDAVSCTHNRSFPGHATVTAQSDGIHVWDLQDLRAVASYSVGEHITFTTPALTLCVTEDGRKTLISYAVVWHVPGSQKVYRGRTIWIIRQSLSGSRVAAREKTDIVVDHPPSQLCGTGHATVPLLLVSQNGSLSLANVRVDIKSRLDWPGERVHMETFVFPRDSCSFIQDDTKSWSSVAVTCCQTGVTLHVRLALLGEEFFSTGTCEIPIASSTGDTDIVILGLTCSPSGILSFIGSHGIWVTNQLAFLNASLVSAPISEHLPLYRFADFKNKKLLMGDNLSVVSLGTSLVLLAGLVRRTPELTLQIWDLSYGVILATQTMPVPLARRAGRICLTVADEGQALLTVCPIEGPEKHIGPLRSSVHIVPVDSRLKSSLASALGKSSLTAAWLIPDASKSQESGDDAESTKIVPIVRDFLKEKKAQQAEQAFLTWVDSHSSKEAVLGYQFVRKIFSIILPPNISTKYPYTPRITRCLLENAVVSTIMLDGRLITALRQRGDWENIMLALTTVMDVSEDELMASAKVVIDRHCKNEHAMEVDTSEGYVPPLWSYIFACVSYSFSVAPMRLAIRKHIPDARDLVPILEILETWIQGGTEHEMEALFKSLATNTQMASGGAGSPPYPKVIAFLQALLDASFVALLQYQPSYDVLRRILSYIQPEITLIDRLEPLRGVLEPFVKAQALKEKTGTSKESPAEWRKRKKQLEQQAGLSVGLYRLEELVI